MIVNITVLVMTNSRKAGEVGMKKILIGLLLAGILMTLAGCSGTARVRIMRNSLLIDNIVLTIRPGYTLAEDAYDVAETDDGYDIIIHAVKEEVEDAY